MNKQLPRGKWIFISARSKWRRKRWICNSLKLVPCVNLLNYWPKLALEQNFPVKCGRQISAFCSPSSYQTIILFLIFPFNWNIFKDFIDRRCANNYFPFSIYRYGFQQSVGLYFECHETLSDIIFHIYLFQWTPCCCCLFGENLADTSITQWFQNMFHCRMFGFMFTHFWAQAKVSFRIEQWVLLLTLDLWDYVTHQIVWRCIESTQLHNDHQLRLKRAAVA